MKRIVSREFVAHPRYGYGAVDEYIIDTEGTKTLLRNTFSGKWLSQKAASWIAGALNQAYYCGATDYRDQINDRDI